MPCGVGMGGLWCRIKMPKRGATEDGIDMRTPRITVAILVATMLIASACSASEVEVTRAIEIETTREG